MIYLGVYRTEEDYDLIEIRQPETVCVIMRIALIGKIEDLPPIPDFLVDDALATLIAYANIINGALGRPQFTIHLNQQEVKMPTIHTSSVLHSGWEMDNELWVVEKAGLRHLLTTSHGEKCTMKKQELLDKIEETRLSLDALEKAAKLMGYDNT